jgi:crotonobetainyl-CoA:carnitine CoA-transferase CaiB-like acyl-CoA transferase
MRPFEGVKIRRRADSPGVAHRRLLPHGTQDEARRQQDALPGILARDGAAVDRPPPRLGQHTDEVLKSVGDSAGEIAALRAAGAVA